MGETEVNDAVKPGQKVDLEEERRKREQAPKARQKPGRPAVVGLESKLKAFYETIVGGMYFLDSDVADFQRKHIDRLAATQAAWAKENAYVRKFLETLVTGGVAAAAIGEAIIVAGGSVMIVQAKRGQLDPRYMPAAAFFGIDLPAPVIRPERSDNGEVPAEPFNPETEDNPFGAEAV
jgi:hypothetical protein